MSVKKQYLKSRPVCKATFTIPKKAAPEARSVHLVGEFNDWNVTASPMKKLKNGSFKLTVELDVGREYQFRYLINEEAWENDWEADRYVPTPFGNTENSVVVI